MLLLLAGITYVVLQFTHFGHIEYTDNARVCQYIAPQNTRVQGFIKEIRFEAYQHVREGDTLVIIEDSEFRLRLAQAKSDLARAQQQSKQAGSSVRTASSNISATEASKAEAKANLDNLAREDKRCEQLLRTGSISQQIADQTRSAYLAAQARYEQICYTIDMQRSMADETSHNRSAVEAAVKLAEAAVELAELNLSYCYIIATHSGFVEMGRSQLPRDPTATYPRRFRGLYPCGCGSGHRVQRPCSQSLRCHRQRVLPHSH